MADIEAAPDVETYARALARALIDQQARHVMDRDAQPSLFE
jgi:hypothetical protein